MRVFLSWSGERSKAVANILYTWIAKVIQAVDPWMSAELQKGARWGTEVAKELEQSRFGIVCLTKENLNENWILFEAGALSKATDGNVWTLLLDINAADVQQPLAQFQHTICEKEDIRRLLHTINTAVRLNNERTINDSLLDSVFETNWPELLGALEAIRSQQPPSDPVERSEREILEEILEIGRGLQRQAAEAEIEKARREVDREVTTLDLMRRHLKLLNWGTTGAVPSNELARYYYKEKRAEDEKKREGSREV